MVYSEEKAQAFAPHIVAVASKAIRYYARGIVRTELLTEQMQAALTAHMQQDRRQLLSRLWYIARCVCGNELYQACFSPDASAREQAFHALRIYVDYVLVRYGYAKAFSQFNISPEDSVQQVLETLFVLFERGKKHGPNDPATFLRWVAVITCRQASLLLKNVQQEQSLSLDAQINEYNERTDEHIDEPMTVDDPLVHVLAMERQETVRDAINSLRNPQHRMVLGALYFAGMDAPEVAQMLRVSVREVYQWKHRAIKQLRKHPLLRELV